MTGRKRPELCQSLYKRECISLPGSLLAASVCFAALTPAALSQTSVTHEFSDGSVASAQQVNENFQDLASAIDGLKIGTGSYDPNWTSEVGFIGGPTSETCDYSRVYSIVTVICSFDAPNFAPGTNRARISLPPGLPVSSQGIDGFKVSGTFSSDQLRNSNETVVGAVVHGSRTSALLLLKGAEASGFASAWANFTYKTDAQ